jgi:hypothetical protein
MVLGCVKQILVKTDDKTGKLGVVIFEKFEILEEVHPKLKMPLL